jgi:GNAT superfamily N-acetyltransferase
VHKGSGVWGDELDHGPLFVIEQFHVVAPELRRKGLGQRIVSLLLSKAERYSLRATRPGVQPLTLHALVLPGWLKADVHLASKSPREEHKLKTQAKDGAIKFWRTCGFRRIGVSKCLAFPFSSQHPSHTLCIGFRFPTSH